MRPRVFPAEDRSYGVGRASPQLASMRPRVFPAEDTNTAVSIDDYLMMLQ